MGAEASASAWGTWEDLVLGGAVTRHGTGDWDVVASELRARTLYPYAFTPQACKERYEDLQKHFSGSTAWFEELRKRRVEELKQELTKSENSIGSLESKIKSLEGEEQDSKQADYCLSETKSQLPAMDSEATESISRQTSNGENSICSFTKDTKPSTSACTEQGKASSLDKFPEVGYGHGVVVRKKRGQRKRKDCSGAVKELSISESDNLGSSNVVSTAKERISGTNNHHGGSNATRRENLIEILESVAESEAAAVFRHRMDSQKRARYRGVIRQHMDIGTIQSRIMGHSIRSAEELFRDLLLLASNALVFYSKRTLKYKSALSLRQLVMKEYKMHCRGHCHEATSAFIPFNPPVKPRTARPHPRPRPPPCKDKAPEKAESVVPVETGKQCESSHNIARQSSLKGKKGLKRPRKLKSEIGDPPRNTTPVRQRKRARR